MSAPDGPVGLAVLRFPASWVAAGRVPDGWEGRWLEVPRVAEGWTLDEVRLPRLGEAVLRPTGRFEVRDDGAVAEVWEVEETGMGEVPVGSTVRDRAIHAVAAYLNGSDHEVPSHLYVAARVWLDLANWGPLVQLGIDLEESDG